MMYGSVRRSPAVKCCGDAMTRNDGLQLNLEGERKTRRVGVIKEQCGEKVLPKMKARVKEGEPKCNWMKRLDTW